MINEEFEKLSEERKREVCRCAYDKCGYFPLRHFETCPNCNCSAFHLRIVSGEYKEEASIEEDSIDSQRKKDIGRGSNDTISGDTKQNEGESIKDEQMPQEVDNHADTSSSLYRATEDLEEDSINVNQSSPLNQIKKR